MRIFTPIEFREPGPARSSQLFKQVSHLVEAVAIVVTHAGRGVLGQALGESPLLVQPLVCYAHLEYVLLLI